MVYKPACHIFEEAFKYNPFVTTLRYVYNDLDKFECLKHEGHHEGPSSQNFLIETSWCHVISLDH